MASLMLLYGIVLPCVAGLDSDRQLALFQFVRRRVSRVHGVAIC